MTIEQPPVVIDRSPPQQLNDAEVRDWAGGQSVFISSVMADMHAERRAAAEAIERVGARPVMFERFGGRDDGAQTAYRKGVRTSDIYVGVLGRRYGIPDQTGYSPTHIEYDEAIRHGLRISVWNTAGEMDGRQQDFLREVQVFHTTGTYTNAVDLGSSIEQRLRAIAASAVSPWNKIGPAVFRARRYIDDGVRVVVEADLRDDDVLAALEELRPDEWRRASTTTATCNGRTRHIKVQTVMVEATGGRARRVRIEGDVVSAQTDTWTNMVSYEGRSPDEMTELGLRVALFGESNPLGSMSFLAEMPDPLAGLRSAQLNEDDLQPVADLLLCEALVGQGLAQRITALQLGRPDRRGERPIRLEWLPPTRYANEIPQRRRIEGRLVV